MDSQHILEHPLHPYIITLLKALSEGYEDNSELVSRCSEIVKLCEETNVSRCSIDQYMIKLIYSLLHSLKEVIEVLKTESESVVSDENDLSNHTHRQNFPQSTVALLEQWFKEHPVAADCTPDAKHELCQLTGLNIKQVSTWLVNRRRRGKPLLQ